MGGAGSGRPSGRAAVARGALARRYERRDDVLAAEASDGAAAEGAVVASLEALSLPPSARAGGDAVMVDAPAPGEVRGR